MMPSAITSVLFLLLTTAPGSGTSARSYAVPESWLDRTLQLESSGNHAAVGDRGRSRGGYQIQRRIWDHYGGKRPWSRWAHNPAESRRVARLVLADCARACRRDHKPVTLENARAYYVRGGFVRGF